MSKGEENTSFFQKLATFIVDRRNLIFFLYAVAIAFCLVTQSWVSVDNDLTDYLPADTETRRGLTIMEDELTTYATARVMISNTTYETAKALADQIEEMDGISSVDFYTPPEEKDEDDAVMPSTDGKTLEDYVQGTNALITVTFQGEEDDTVSEDALDAIEELLSPYDTSIVTEVGYSMSDTLDDEMGIILAVAAVIIILVLLLTSRSYAELPVLLLTFCAAALLNKGTNFIFGTISYVSDSVTVVLQLALAIDYSIILLHRFLEEREHLPDDRSACITAVAAAIPAISASSLTTISGLAAMMFMQFRIGFDLGMVLIKAICFSMMAVFTLMPGLLMVFSRAMEKTRHRSFIPTIDRWGNLVYKVRYIGVPVFLVCIAAGFWLSNQCPYVYGQNTVMTERRNDHQAAEDRVKAVFGDQNIMALLVPKGDTDKERALLADLSQYDEVDYAMGLGNIKAKGYALNEALTPRQFSEVADVDYEEALLLYAAYANDQEDYGRIVGGLNDYSVPLMDMFLFLYDEKEDGYFTLDDDKEQDVNDMHDQLIDAQNQMVGENYDRLVISLNLPEEGDETFAFLKTIHQAAEKYYDADSIYLVGDSTSDYDQSTSFARDNVMISILSVVFVILVLIFTFMSVGQPILLILVIQGSIWINFTFPTLTNTSIFFMSYLIVTSIQMGANIDYAIVISTWYSETKEKMPRKEAIIKALDLSFPTVLTSGSILSAAGYLIGKITTEPSIVGIGQCLSRGTLISMFLVMFVLPQILLLGDTIVEKTRFKLKTPELKKSVSGKVVVNGRVRGRISGVVDANMRGVIYGDVDAIMDIGTIEELKPGEAPGHPDSGPEAPPESGPEHSTEKEGDTHETAE